MTDYNPNNKHCFIDSNIWLYSFIENQDSNKTNLARALIQKNTVFITVSTQIINEVCINLIKKAKFSEEKISALIKSYYQKYQVTEIDKNVLLKASCIRKKHSFSFWDSIVIASALSANAEILFSEDMQDGFVIENIKILNPLNT